MKSALRGWVMPNLLPWSINTYPPVPSWLVRLGVRRFFKDLAQAMQAEDAKDVVRGEPLELRRPRNHVGSSCDHRFFWANPMRFMFKTGGRGLAWLRAFKMHIVHDERCPMISLPQRRGAQGHCHGQRGGHRGRGCYRCAACAARDLGGDLL